MPDHKYDITKKQDSAHKKRSLFGRRQGRALRGERAQALDDIMPEIEICESDLLENQSTHPAQLFDKDFSQYWLEIGFGHGEHVKELAQRHLDTGFIGAEPFVNGMGSFLKSIHDQSKDNIRVLMDDGMIIARSLAPSSVDGIYVLNPDPWHKKRHHKRRIINQENLGVLARILKPGGKLVMTSDVPDLAGWMCMHASHHPAFEWSAQEKKDWSEAPADWIKTKYEVKGAKGAKKMVYLFFERTDL